MEIMFTPWRMQYIKNSDGSRTNGCVFCTIMAASAEFDAENLVLVRARHCFVVLNRYPYGTAHLMVVPYVHTADLHGLDPDVSNELFDLTRRSVDVIKQEYAPHGFNIGMNLGQIAGAGIADHLHMHIVPRWSGDANFMPLIGGTRMIPEDLEHTYARLQSYRDCLLQV
jgi:ATP adenylyltransferase